jgi:hypothetical protein
MCIMMFVFQHANCAFLIYLISVGEYNGTTGTKISIDILIGLFSIMYLPIYFYALGSILCN